MNAIAQLELDSTEENKGVIGWARAQRHVQPRTRANAVRDDADPTARTRTPDLLVLDDAAHARAGVWHLVPGFVEVYSPPPSPSSSYTPKFEPKPGDKLPPTALSHLASSARAHLAARTAPSHSHSLPCDRKGSLTQPSDPVSEARSSVPLLLSKCQCCSCSSRWSPASCHRSALDCATSRRRCQNLIQGRWS